jgi:hypothetical protein
MHAICNQFDLYLLSFLSTGSTFSSYKISLFLLWLKTMFMAVLLKQNHLDWRQSIFIILSGGTNFASIEKMRRALHYEPLYTENDGPKHLIGLCCSVHRMALWHFLALQCTEWTYDISLLFSAQNGRMKFRCCPVHRMPYDISLLFTAQNGFMKFPWCPVHRMALWHFLAVQCTEWPYDMSMLSSAQNGLMTYPCCPVHRMALWHVHAVKCT